MEIREILENSIKTALLSLQIPTLRSEQVDKVQMPQISLEHPEDVTHGDYSTNISMVLAKAVAQNPRELAGKIVAEILERLPKEILKVEVAGPGFINFFLAPEFFISQTKEILKGGKKFGTGKALKGQKVLLEKSAPNLFKPFHVGHFLNLTIGESLSRIFAFSGAKVISVAYPSDVSLGASKAVWAIINKKLQDNLTINVLGECYAYGTKMYDEDEKIKQEIIEINKKINAKESGAVWNVYKNGRNLSLKYFKDITKRLDSKFSSYFYESDAGIIGKKIVEENIGKLFEKSEGAVIFKGEEYGLHTRVFITSQGLPVYEAKDIGLIKMKFKKYNPDVSLVITDVEQKQYFEVIKKVATLIHGSWGEKSAYWQHGRMSFEGGDISSRYGNVPLAEDLIEEVKKRVLQKISSVDKKSFVEAGNTLIEQIALSGLRYSLLRSSPGKNIIFDFDKSISFEGDSGPYLQYSYARAKSILRKAKEQRVKSKIDPSQIKSQFDGASITMLEKLLYRFPEVVERAGKEYSPHYIATYLIELSSSFNNFYANGKIVDKADKNSPYKVALTEAFSIVLKNGLNLLGIQAPEKM